MFGRRDDKGINWNVVDKRINTRVAQTFVRRGIDSNKLQYSSSHGTVLVTGFMRSMSGVEINSVSKMQIMQKEIKKIQHVVGVKWKLTNWERREGKWIKHKVQQKAPTMQET